MKIKRGSNYDLDYFEEKFVEGLPVMNEKDLRLLCRQINDKIDPHGDVYYSVVADDYVLGKGFEP